MGRRNIRWTNIIIAATVCALATIWLKGVFDAMMSAIEVAAL